MSKYIKPPRSEDCVWRTGVPPSVGWWPASSLQHRRDPTWLRYWNGKSWSVGDRADQDANYVAQDVFVQEPKQQDIRWTDRWWEIANA